MKSHSKEDGSEEAGGPPEVVQRGADLPKLPEWSPETGPIDFSDWLLVIQPLMGDLSSSEEWWQAMVEAAKAWYMSHMGKTPLERLQHHPMPPPMLTQKKWARLERRAASLLLAAIPEGLREEVVSSRSLSTLGILTKGMIQYQPGGLAEKSAILAALESPQEAQSIASGVTTLRRWLRWKRRAEDLGVSIPDATILVRGEWKCQRNGITKQVDMYGLISQSSYVEDLLNAGEDKPKSRKIPITRDQAGMEQSEDLPTAQIRSAQKVVGELLWLDEDQT